MTIGEHIFSAFVGLSFSAFNLGFFATGGVNFEREFNMLGALDRRIAVALCGCRLKKKTKQTTLSCNKDVNENHFYNK